MDLASFTLCSRRPYRLAGTTQTLHKLVANKLVAELRSNSTQPTLLAVEGENTDVRTRNPRMLRSKEENVGTRPASISTRRQGSEPTQRNSRNQETLTLKVD